jgi:hypothetical protein
MPSVRPEHLLEVGERAPRAVRLHSTRPRLRGDRDHRRPPPRGDVGSAAPSFTPSVSTPGARASFAGARWTAPHGALPRARTRVRSRSADAAQQQPAAAHVAATDELRRKAQPLAEHVEQQVHVLAGGDAAQQHDARFIRQRRPPGCGCPAAAARGSAGREVDGHGAERGEVVARDGLVGRQQAAVRRDDQRARPDPAAARRTFLRTSACRGSTGRSGRRRPRRAALLRRRAAARPAGTSPCHRTAVRPRGPRSWRATAGRWCVRSCEPRRLRPYQE